MPTMDLQSDSRAWAPAEGAPGRAVEVTVIVPAKNEAESIPVLAGEIETALDGTGMAWECLWIDDGSTDGTLEVLRGLHRRRAAHQFLSFDHNYGQSAALAAGFREAAGEILVTLDADLQNDPGDIPRLLAVLATTPVGMVNAVRARRHDSFTRRVSSRIANGFRNWVTHETVTDVGCSLRAFRADCVRDIPLFRGMHRFLPTFARLRGHRIVEVPAAHRPRRYGRTKYGVNNRLWVGLLDTLWLRWLQERHVRPVVWLNSRELEAEAAMSPQPAGGAERAVRGETAVEHKSAVPPQPGQGAGPLAQAQAQPSEDATRLVHAGRSGEDARGETSRGRG